MLGGMLTSMFGSVLAQPFGTRFCKVKLSFWINILNAALGVACFWLPLEFWVIPLIAHVLIQIVQGGNGALQWSMITDANNYGEWKTQRRITGMNVAANIFVIKLGSPSVVPFWVGCWPGLITSRTVPYSQNPPFRVLFYCSH